MKRLLTTLAAAAIALAASLSANTIAVSDTLHYNIEYKWGFIQKVAGHGTVTLKATGDTLKATLSGHSIPWGGRLYSVADTLHTVTCAADGLFSQTVLYENGWYTKPLVADSTRCAHALAPIDYRTIQGKGLLSADASTMEAITITADMLGYFYLVRLIDFPSRQPGEAITVPITMPDGSKKKLEITYNGTTLYNGTDAYSVTFNYSYAGQMSAYPVNTVIDAKSRIPLSVGAELLIGHLEMLYQP